MDPRIDADELCKHAVRNKYIPTDVKSGPYKHFLRIDQKLMEPTYQI
jgi:hypothetical protein